MRQQQHQQQKQGVLGMTVDIYVLQAYYGGEARCGDQAGGGDVYDPKELVCGGCSDVSRAQVGY